MVRYMDVRRILADEIARGVHPVGTRFPTDHELCERFGVSRHTIREALRKLQDEELIVRQRGFGTTVGAGRKADAFRHGFGSIAELDSYAMRSEFLKHSEGVVTLRPYMAGLLDCDEGSKWLRYAGVRQLRGSDRPLGWTEIFVAEPYIDLRDRLTNGPMSFYEQISTLGGFRIQNVEQQISAADVPQELWEVLGVTAVMPALLVRRKYYGENNAVFEITLSVHPADRYIHSMSIPRVDRDPR